MELVNRETYVKQLIEWKDHDVIKVITWIRRSWKSTLFELYINYLKTHWVKEDQIIFLNFENPLYSNASYLEVYKLITEKIDENQKYYVFLDEIQNIKDFQKTVDGLYIIKNIDVYITWSNAFLLSWELATLLSWRYIEIKMLPLSFSEYCSAFDTDNYQKLFLEYLKNWWMPWVLPILKTHPQWLPIYFEDIISTIVQKDVMERLTTASKPVLNSILLFLADSIWSPISAKKISDTLTSKWLPISNHTVEKYIQAYKDSYILYKAERFNLKGKNLLVRDWKWYMPDTWIRNALIGKRMANDTWHLLENIVYFELLRRWYNVSIWKIGDLEIDFIAEKRDEIHYYQVALSVREKNVLERELRPLQNTWDFYPKTLLTADIDLDADYNWIEQQNVINWLLWKKWWEI